MIKTLIVDDEHLARRGLEIRLAGFDDVEVVGQSRNGREALEHVEQFQPNLMLLDVQMPGMSGFDVLRRLSMRRRCVQQFEIWTLGTPNAAHFQGDIAGYAVESP